MNNQEVVQSSPPGSDPAASSVTVECAPSDNRSGALDFVRVLSVVAIVAGQAWTREVTAVWVYSWHVPVFFILSGYLWRPGRTFKLEVRKRIASLGRPYLTWLIICTLALLTMGVITREQVVSRVVDGFLGGAFAILPYTTFWFVSALLFTTLAFRVMEKLPYALQWVIGLAGAAAGWLWGPAFSFTPLGIGYVVTCLIYLLVGDGLRRIRKLIPLAWLVGSVLIVLCAVLIWQGVSTPIDIKTGDYGVPFLSLVTSSAISVGLILISETIIRPGLLSRLCTAAALPLLPVVLAHPIFLWVPSYPWVKFLAGLLVPFAVGYIALRTPLAFWVIGQPRLDLGRRALQKHGDVPAIEQKDM